MLHVRPTVKTTSVLSSPRPWERPEADWSNISHTRGKRPMMRHPIGCLVALALLVTLLAASASPTGVNPSL
jgi:hypothetical protein